MFRLIVALVLSFSLTTAFAKKKEAPAAAEAAATSEATAPAKSAAKAKKKVEKATEAASPAKKEASPAQLAHRAKMKACNKDAKTQGLKGDARKAFMKDCLKKA